MITKILHEKINNIVAKEYEVAPQDFIIEVPDNPKFGNLSTNIAMVLAGKLKQSPIEIAKNLVYRMQEVELAVDINGVKVKIFKNIEFLAPGFINFTYSEEWLNIVLNRTLTDDVSYGTTEYLAKKRTVIEFTDPNPFKVFHIGHLMTNCIGESLARLLESQGAQVKRLNYQGDVGMHVAKSVWGILNKLKDQGKKSLDEMSDVELDEKVAFLGECYAYASSKYSADERAKKEMHYINSMIYKISQVELLKEKDIQPVIEVETFLEPNFEPYAYGDIRNAYITGRKWSLAYFETLYNRLGTHFDKYYFECETGEVGYKIVKDAFEKGEYFEKSEGAIIYRGEKDGLHTRVFINSAGLPVYESKDLGLALMKYNDFEYDDSYIITANEVDDYFKVVFKVLEKLNPHLADKNTHIGHGMMRFKEGKMSSRTGDVVAGDALLNNIRDEVVVRMEENYKDVEGTRYLAERADKIAVGAIKYSILKNSIGSDIIYDHDQSLSLQGNSGPYLMYAYVRANSILEKSGSEEFDPLLVPEVINDAEKLLISKMAEYTIVVHEAAKRLSPSLMAAFLHDFAKTFNSYYAEVPILNEANPVAQKFRLRLVKGVSIILRNGLDLLGIQVVDKM